MKAYRLVEVDVPSIADSWRASKEAIASLVSNIVSEVEKQRTSVRETCGQDVERVTLEKPGDSNTKLKITAWNGDVRLQIGSVLLGTPELKNPLGYSWPVSLRTVREAVKWLSSVTTEDIGAAIVATLEGSDN